jgi:hypothetical protein
MPLALQTQLRYQQALASVPYLLWLLPASQCNTHLYREYQSVLAMLCEGHAFYRSLNRILSVVYAMAYAQRHL